MEMRFKTKGAAFDFLCLEGATFLGPVGVSDTREPGGPGRLSTGPICLLPVDTAALLLQRNLQLLSVDGRDHLLLTPSCRYTEELTKLFVCVCARVPKFLIDGWAA